MRWTKRWNEPIALVRLARMTHTEPLDALFAEDEPEAVQSVAGSTDSPFVLTCDHAGRRLPRKLGTLGLSPSDLESHIAWDIGAAEVARGVAARLGAALHMQTVSRLVIDCNRPLSAPDSIARRSEAIVIPGNEHPSVDDARRRARDVFEPYHARLFAELERRAIEDRPTCLVAIHSFTPVFHGVGRPWHVGLLYRQQRLAGPLLQELRRPNDLIVGDNEPYSMADGSDYTLIEHGERRGILHVGVEIRQDLLGDEAGQERWARRIAETLERAYESCRA